MHVNRILYGRSGRAVFFWIFIFPTLVSILVMLSVFFRHIAFVLLFADLLCGMCFIHSNSQKCYFYDLLLFGVYLTLPVLPFLQLLSNIFEFSFLAGPNLSSFHIYFSICLVLPTCFLLRIYLSYFENMPQNISFFFPLLGLYLFNILHCICVLLLARSRGVLPRLFSGLVGQLFPGHVNVDWAAFWVQASQLFNPYKWGILKVQEINCDLCFVSA